MKSFTFFAKNKKCSSFAILSPNSLFVNLIIPKLYFCFVPFPSIAEQRNQNIDSRMKLRSLSSLVLGTRNQRACFLAIAEQREKSVIHS